jgi:hypothetical protein
MAIDWQAVLVTFGGNAALLGVGAWLAKALISNQLSKDADAFRINLQAQTNVEIERLRSLLQIAATEHQVRFTKLHEERGEVIAKLYGLLLESADAARFFTAHAMEHGDEGQKAREAHLDLYRFLNLKRIYLPSRVCELLENYESKLGHSVVFLSVYFKERSPNPQMIQEQVKVMREAWATVETELPAIRRALEIEFRQLLGVEPGK